MSKSELPDTLAEIRDGFLETPEADRLLLLLEYSDELPEVSEEVANHPETVSYTHLTLPTKA